MFNQTKISPEDYKLLDLGILDIRGKTDGDMASFVRQALLYLESKGSPDITIKITSQGGEVDPALNIYDMLVAYKGYKTCLVIAFANSMATVIVQAADLKKCLPHSTMLLHYISPLSSSPINLSLLKNKLELNKLIKHLDIRQDIINNIYLDKTKMSLSQLKKVLKQEKPLPANELIKLGLIDEILTENVFRIKKPPE